jgi:hypothetical protein
MKAGGAVASGFAANSAAKLNAQGAEMNAGLARQAAAVQAQDIEKRGRYLMGTQLARTAASGIDPTSGSPLQVMADSAAAEETNAQRALYQGEVSATGYFNQAKVMRYQGSQALAAGITGAGTTLLTTGSDMAAYQARKKAGTLTPANTYGIG